MNAALELAYDSIADAKKSSMDPEDTRILKLTGRNVASYASTIEPSSVVDGSLKATLSATWDKLDRLLQTLNFTSSKEMDQHSHGLSDKDSEDDYSKGYLKTMTTEPGAAAQPFFGRFRRDNYDAIVKKLM
eukprot:10009629-Ditylum_brightwellii.AAC.1